MALPVNFKDDVLASSMDGKRRYNMITNSDGTVSFEDVTTYSQEGSNFGSAQVNATNGAVNTINNNVLDTIEEITANTSSGKFAGALAVKEVNNSLVSNIYVGDDGKLHKVQGGADSVLPFSKGKLLFNIESALIYNTMATQKWGYVDVSAYDEVNIYYGTTYQVILYIYDPSGNKIKSMTGNTSTTLTVTNYDTIYFSQSENGAWFTLKVEAL